MPKLRLIGLVLLTAGLVIAPGCVELTGQRISWFYDAAKDELQILIHYDGIHDSGDDRNGKGVEQVPAFVKGGSVLIVDWPFQLQMPEVRQKIRDEDAEPAHRDWARLITTIETRPVGYYREPNGRIGAAQLVTIPKAKEFVRKLNGLISTGILTEEVDLNDPLGHTQQRIHAAAKNGHQWIALEGHAIRIAIPVHPGEWAKAKAEFLNDTAEYVADALGDDGSDEERNNISAVILALSSAPVSYIDEGDRVEFVLGGPRKPSNVRLIIRGEYEPSLEKVVVDSVKIDLDKTRAETLLAKGAEPSAAPDALWSWGPPEDQVRALLAGTEHDDAKIRQAAVKRLESWSGRWNRDRGSPRAPTPMDDTKKYIEAWKQWYGQVTYCREADGEEQADEPEKEKE